jgi:hypothetical protein
VDEDKRAEEDLLVGELRCGDREFTAAVRGNLWVQVGLAGGTRADAATGYPVAAQPLFAAPHQPLQTSEVSDVLLVMMPFALILITMVALIIQLSSDFDPFRKILEVNVESAVAVGSIGSAAVKLNC